MKMRFRNPHDGSYRSHSQTHKKKPKYPKMNMGMYLEELREEKEHEMFLDSIIDSAESIKISVLKDETDDNK